MIPIVGTTKTLRGEHMTADAETKTDTPSNNAAPTPPQPPKAINPAAVKKAVALGKDVRKQPDKSKADAAREIYALISGEPREIIIQAFIDGAGLTPKGAQTYFYNCKRKATKKAE
jgi:lipoprotein-anchoring transpeptidase ErfK/SrfK